MHILQAIGLTLGEYETFGTLFLIGVTCWRSK